MILNEKNLISKILRFLVKISQILFIPAPKAKNKNVLFVSTGIYSSDSMLFEREKKQVKLRLSGIMNMLFKPILGSDSSISIGESVELLLVEY